MDNLAGINAADFAYYEIRRRILIKDLKPGQRLAEVSVAKDVGVSRTPVREALRRLASEGWLSMVQNSGVWVTSPTRREILDAYEMRSKLEMWAISKAMPNITPLVIRKLEENLQDEEDVYKHKKSEAYPDINSRFHLLIAEAGGNDALCQHLAIALSRTLIYMALFEDYFDFNNYCSLSEHAEIFESIKAMNEQEAISRMQAHIERGYKDLRM